MKRSHGILPIAVAVFVAGAPAGVYAGFGEEGAHEKKHKMMQEVIAELGVTEEQLGLIEEQRSKAWQVKKEMKEQIKDRKAVLKKELLREEVDRAKVDQLVAEISDLRDRKLRAHVDSILEIRSILTPEQFGEFQKKMESMKKEADQDTSATG